MLDVAHLRCLYKYLLSFFPKEDDVIEGSWDGGGPTMKAGAQAQERGVRRAVCRVVGGITVGI